MKVIVVGCLGQMGQPVSRFVAEREGMELVGGVGPAGRDYIGRDLGQVVGLGRDLGIPVADDLSSVIDACDALIDVSSVEQCLSTWPWRMGKLSSRPARGSRPNSSNDSKRPAGTSRSSSNATPRRW